MTSYACMTPEEYALWAEAAARVRNGGSAPCFDCPAWFAAKAQAEGCCQRRPRRSGRPQTVVRRQWLPRDPAAAERRRQYKRDWMRARRARAKGYNADVEYSDPIAHNAQRPVARLYSESRGVDVPEYRRNA